MMQGPEPSKCLLKQSVAAVHAHVTSLVLVILTSTHAELIFVSTC